MNCYFIISGENLKRKLFYVNEIIGYKNTIFPDNDVKQLETFLKDIIIMPTDHETGWLILSILENAVKLLNKIHTKINHPHYIFT